NAELDGMTLHAMIPHAKREVSEIPEAQRAKTLRPGLRSIRFRIASSVTRVSGIFLITSVFSSVRPASSSRPASVKSVFDRQGLEPAQILQEVLNLYCRMYRELIDNFLLILQALDVQARLAGATRVPLQAQELGLVFWVSGKLPTTRKSHVKKFIVRL